MPDARPVATQVPYRHPDPPREAPPPPSELFCPWDIMKDRPLLVRLYAAWQVFGLGSWLFFSVLAILVLVLASLPTALAALFTVALVVAVPIAIVRGLQRLWASRGTDGVRLRVEGGTLSILRRGEAPVLIPLGAIRDVEIESNAAQQGAYERRAGEALPTMAARVNGGLARIVFVLDGDALPVRLSDARVTYDHCAEWFGKVRVFLRKYGWLPQDERK